MSETEWPRTKSDGKNKGNGRLPIHIPEQTFLADFNHRVKVVGKSAYFLATQPKKESEVTKPMAERIKTNCGSILRQVRYLDWAKDCEKIRKRVLAPIEHLFSNHEFCEESWCLAKRAQKEKEYRPDQKNILYDKTKHKKMYNQLFEAVSRYQEDRNVIECLHNRDTNINES